MKHDLKEKRAALEKRIIYVKHEMERFLHCGESALKFTNPLYIDDKFRVLAKYIYCTNEKITESCICTRTVYFDFEGVYLKHEGIWFEGKFYLYDKLVDFLNAVVGRISRNNNYYPANVISDKNMNGITNQSFDLKQVF